MSSVKINGAWKDFDKVYAKVNDVWKTVDKIFTNINGTWKEGYSGELVLYSSRDHLNILMDEVGGTGKGVEFSNKFQLQCNEGLRVRTFTVPIFSDMNVKQYNIYVDWDNIYFGENCYSKWEIEYYSLDLNTWVVPSGVTYLTYSKFGRQTNKLTTKFYNANKIRVSVTSSGSDYGKNYTDIYKIWAEEV